MTFFEKYVFEKKEEEEEEGESWKPQAYPRVLYHFKPEAKGQRDRWRCGSSLDLSQVHVITRQTL